MASRLEWQPNTVYVIGAMTIGPDGLLYKANQSHVSGSSFNSANWTGLSNSGSALFDPTSFVSGSYFRSLNGAGSTRVLGVGQRWGVPFFLPKAATIDSISCEVTTLGAGALARLGIYNHDPVNRKPSSLIVAGAATADCSATGFKTVALAATALAAGFYWGVLQPEGAACTVRGGGNYNFNGFAEGSLSSASPAFTILSSGAVAGSLPANWNDNSTDTVWPTLWLHMV